MSQAPKPSRRRSARRPRSVTDLSPVDEVIKKVKCVIDWSIESESPIGYFAALYLRVTKSIRGAIEAGQFECGPRMVDFDVAFASRYFDAVIAHWDPAKTPTRVWRNGFQDHDGKDRLIILQHLMTAMNAHIDLDLGVATEEIYRKSPDTSLESLHHDFTAVNTVLATQIPGVLQVIGELSPEIKKYRKWVSDNFINAGLVVFREDAWRFACGLADEPAARRARMISERDAGCAWFGNWYIHPVPSVPIIDAIREKECPDIAHNIEVLSERTKTPAALPRKLW
jgi:hypothetical protein